MSEPLADAVTTAELRAGLLKARTLPRAHANVEQIRFVRGRPATSALDVGTSLAMLVPEDSDELRAEVVAIASELFF